MPLDSLESSERFFQTETLPDTEEIGTVILASGLLRYLDVSWQSLDEIGFRRYIDFSRRTLGDIATDKHVGRADAILSDKAVYPGRINMLVERHHHDTSHMPMV